jgi:hypothetical protein
MGPRSVRSILFACGGGSFAGPADPFRECEPPPSGGFAWTAMIRATLYSKPECCLCDEARAVIEAVASDRPLVLEEIDITGDADLMQQYGESVPVVLIDGRPTYEYHVDERDLRQRVAAAGATA